MWIALPNALPLTKRHRARREQANPRPAPIPYSAAALHAPDAWLSESDLARDLAAYDGRPFTPTTFERLRRWGGAPPFQYQGKRAFYLWSNAIRWASNISIHPDYFKPKTWR